MVDLVLLLLSVSVIATVSTSIFGRRASFTEDVFVGGPGVGASACKDVPGYAPEEVEAALTSARTALARLDHACSRMPRYERTRLDGVRRRCRSIVDAVAARPTLLPKAQHFLDAYLEGMAVAAERFASLARKDGDPAMRERFSLRMEKLNRVCDAQEKVFLAQEKEQLDIDMTVLERRMSIDGHDA